MRRGCESLGLNNIPKPAPPPRRKPLPHKDLRRFQKNPQILKNISSVGLDIADNNSIMEDMNYKELYEELLDRLWTAVCNDHAGYDSVFGQILQEFQERGKDDREN